MFVLFLCISCCCWGLTRTCAQVKKPALRQRVKPQKYSPLGTQDDEIPDCKCFLLRFCVHIRVFMYHSKQCREAILHCPNRTPTQTSSSRAAPSRTASFAMATRRRLVAAKRHGWVAASRHSRDDWSNTPKQYSVYMA